MPSSHALSCPLILPFLFHAPYLSPPTSLLNLFPLPFSHQFIGLPTTKARYEILRSCINELMRVGIVAPHTPLPSFDEPVDDAMDAGAEAAGNAASLKAGLLSVAEKAEGFR
jgi:hypothetical protein